MLDISVVGCVDGWELDFDVVVFDVVWVGDQKQDIDVGEDFFKVGGCCFVGCFLCLDIGLGVVFGDFMGVVVDEDDIVFGDQSQEVVVGGGVQIF